MNEEGDFYGKGTISFIFVVPALLSVLGFIVGIIFRVNAFKNLNDIWTGYGGMSALPIYFGLSALASAILIKPEIIITDYSQK